MPLPRGWIELTALRLRVDSVVEEDGSFTELRFHADVDEALTDLRFNVQPLSSAPIGDKPPPGGDVGTPRKKAHVRLGVRHGGIFHPDTEMADFNVGLSDLGSTFEFHTHGLVAKMKPAWHGFEIDQGGAPPAGDRLDVEFEVDFDPSNPDTEVVFYPILTDARSQRSARPMLGHGPTVIRGVGYLSCFSNVKLCFLTKRAGEEDEATHGELIIDILLEIGIPRSRIGVSPRLGSTLQGLYEPRLVFGVAEAKRIALTAGHVLLDAPDGQVITRPIAPVDEPPVMEIGPEHWVTDETAAELVTEPAELCVRIIGSRPVVPDVGDGFTLNRRRVTQTIEPRALEVAAFLQQTNGDLSPIPSAPPFEVLMVVSEVWLEELFFRGCIVRRTRETYTLFNPETARYFTAGPPGNLSGEPRTYAQNALVFGAGAVKDDASPSRQYIKAQLVITAIDQEEFVYDGEDGLQGALIQTTTSVGEWRSLEAARKENLIPGDDWEAENVRPNVGFFGGGRLIAPPTAGQFTQEFFFSERPPSIGGVRRFPTWSSQVVIDETLVRFDTPTGRDLAHVSQRDEEEEAYERTVGVSFQYADGGESKDGSEVQRTVRTTTTPYTPEVQNTHSAVSSTVWSRSPPPSPQIITERGLAGYLPVADQCTDELNALKENVEVIGRHCLGDPEKYKGSFEESFAFGVETSSQADDLALQIHRQRSAHSITCTVPMGPQWRHKMPIKFHDFRPRELNPPTGLGDPPGVIDPDKYPHLSNAWVEFPTLVEVLDDDGVPMRRMVRMIIRLPFI